jgi:hypothetical protein
LIYPSYRFAGTQIHEESNLYQHEYLSAITLPGPAHLLVEFTGCSGVDAARGKGIPGRATEVLTEQSALL